MRRDWGFLYGRGLRLLDGDGAGNIYTELIDYELMSYDGSCQMSQKANSSIQGRCTEMLNSMYRSLRTNVGYLVSRTSR